MTLALVACSGGNSTPSKAKLEKQQAQFTAKIEKLEDPEMREVFSQLGLGYFMVQGMGLDMQKRPVGSPVYTEDPFAALSDYATPQDALDNYLGGLFLINDPDYFRDSVDVQAPFTYPYGLDIAWDYITLDNGETMTFTDEFRAPPPAFYAVNGGSRLKVSFPESEDDSQPPLPVRAKGTLTANVPSAIHRFDFSKRGAGKSHKAGAYTIKLKSIDYHILTFEISRNDGAPVELDTDMLIIGAKDKTGQYLDDSGSGTGSPDEMDDLYKILNSALDEALAGKMDPDSAEADLEAMAQAYMNDAPQTLTYQYYLRGKVDRVELAFLEPGEQITRELDIEMTNFDAPNEDDAPIRAIPVQAVVYNSELETMLTRARSGEAMELTADEVASAIVVDEPELRYDILHVDFEYPELTSTVFLSNFDRYEDWDDDDFGITFYDANGAVIDVPTEDEDGPYEFTVNRFEIDVNAFPAPPVRAEGFLTVNILPDITLETVSSDALPEGIRIEDNRVIYSSAFRRNDVQLYGVDAAGRPLQSFASIQHSRSETPMETVNYYYGKPAGIVIMRRGAEQKVRYDFETSLAVDTPE